MGYIEETFERMDLRQIRSFLLYGADELDGDEVSYEKRLKNGSNPIYCMLHSLYPIEDECNKATADLAQALTTYEAVYMEIGMKAGAKLLFQLLHTDDKPPLEKA